jgi:lipid-binding SYLF domain-containing protein
MKRALLSLLVVAGCAAMNVGCESEPRTPEQQESMRDSARAALSAMQAADNTLDGVLNDAAGYAIFPNVGKGGLVVGGAQGRGEVFQNGNFIGYAQLQQASVGLQAGGQTFRELIVFQDQAALDRFKEGKVEFAANVSAIALKAGAARSAEFKDGIAVFVDPTGGLMAEASIGGQRFTFTPAEGPEGRGNPAEPRTTTDTP